MEDRPATLDAFGPNGGGRTRPLRSKSFTNRVTIEGPCSSSLPTPQFELAQLNPTLNEKGFDDDGCRKPVQCSTPRNTPTEGTPDDRYQRLERHWFDERYAPAEATVVATSFRHSFWAASRERTRRAMVDAGLGAARRYRFQECGAKPIVEIDFASMKVRVRSTNCHDRWCRACGQVRRQRLARALTGEIPKAKCLALVLTPMSRTEPLGTSISRLLKNFTNLRRSKWWQARVAGGAWVLETTYNRQAEQWHPHLHILVHAEWLQLQELSAAWHKVTGDSHRVHVSLVRESRGHSAARELCKYVGKIAHRSWEHDRELLTHAIQSLHGRRLEGAFGSWRHVSLQGVADAQPVPTWTVWGTLDALMRLAERADVDARALLRAIQTGQKLIVPTAGSATNADLARPPP